MAAVSVIMAVYNCRETVQKALQSVQEQNFADLEIIIVDDQSTDGTYEFLQSIVDRDRRIRLIRAERNLGAYHARALALQKTEAEWVTLIDADDWYERDRIEILLNAARELKADLILDNLKIFDHSLNRIVERTNYCAGNQVKPLSIDYIFKNDHPLMGNNSIGYSKPMVRMEFLRRHRIDYWKKYRNTEDYAFLAEIVIAGAKAFIIPQASYVYRHSVSPSSQKISPYSHSKNDSELIIARVCDELMQKYGSVLSERSRELLQRRKKIFLTSHIASEQNHFLFQKQYFHAGMLFLKYPHLLLYRFIGVGNRIKRFVSLSLHSFSGHFSAKGTTCW